MLSKRIIPCLDVKDGKVVKGINFFNLQNAGSAVELAEKYYKEGADELVFLDITATIERRKTLIDLVREISKVILIPFTVGGGIENIRNIEELLKAGADKVSLNSAIVNNPYLISESAKAFGCQAIIAAIDVNNNKVFINGGRVETNLTVYDWCKQVEDLGAGEILLTSMNRDGTQKGYDINLLKMITEKISIPVIASGGAGKKEHFLEAFQNTKVDACLAASLFHFNQLSIKELKKYLISNKIIIRS